MCLILVSILDRMNNVNIFRTFKELKSKSTVKTLNL